MAVKILILGGNGYFGRNIAAQFANNIEFEVTVGSRSGNTEDTIYFNWADLERSFRAFSNFDVIVNASDLPDETDPSILVKWVTANNKIFIETTAEAKYLKKLINLKSNPDRKFITGEGLFVVGAGIFPGISNLLVRHHLSKYPDKKDLRLCLRYSIFSAAGMGMSKLMSKTLSQNSSWKDHGEIRNGPPVSKVENMTWRNEVAPAMRIYLSDLEFYCYDPDISSFETFLSVSPNFLNRWSRIINYLPSTNLTQWILTNFFYIIRGKLLSQKKTSMEIMVDDGSNKSNVFLNDAFAVGSRSIFELALKCLALKPTINGGIFYIEDLISLTELANYGVVTDM